MKLYKDKAITCSYFGNNLITIFCKIFEYSPGFYNVIPHLIISMKQVF